MFFDRRVVMSGVTDLPDDHVTGVPSVESGALNPKTLNPKNPKP
jgi:hypothetical protein